MLQTDGLDSDTQSRSDTPVSTGRSTCCTAVRMGLLLPQSALWQAGPLNLLPHRVICPCGSQGCSCWVSSSLGRCPRANPTTELVFSLQQRTWLHGNHTSLLSQAPASHFSSPPRHSVLPVWLDFQESEFRHTLYILAKSSLWCFSCERPGQSL